MSPIEHQKGNLLDADVEALVNTVNTVGVMGKGIALQFRKAFPANYKAYKQACDAGEVKPGKMFVFETGQLTGPRLIINFPTKRHWKGKARMEDIQAGLHDLVAVVRSQNVRSVAVPPLGCGNGGLAWSEVKPTIEEALAPLDDVRVLLFAPAGPPPPHRQRVATKPPRMTRGRAGLLAALAAYRTDPATTITRLVAQKMAYLLQAAGEPLKLTFVKGDFGPYAEAINHVLQGMEGHFIRGYGDRTGPAAMRLDPDAVRKAHEFFSDDPEGQEHLERLRRLIEGFESPSGLELLATVHWAAAEEGSQSPDEALKVVASWTARKRDAFPRDHVAAAWDRLEDEGWLAATSVTA